ncbi:MAG TPA: WYL domain-containing protein, partial [Gemmatimonadales bacterium]|nr:WYL domain-containing protein [Gemmatimonadales bacterium]
PALTEFTGSAMRKLAFDLPTDVSVHEAAAAYAVADAVSTVRAPAALPLRRAIPQDELFELLDEALRRRKTVTITYHTMGSGRDGTRAVMPYGVFFLGHHWYLAARDSADGPVKNFRLSRIHDATLNTTRPGTPDYEIPAGFSLAEHARSRSAWELGDTATVEALVRFDGASGPTHAALRLGEPVEGDPRVRRFHVRRQDTFLRWLLSFAGEAEPVSPPELVSEYRELARRTLAAYAEAV